MNEIQGYKLNEKRITFGDVFYKFDKIHHSEAVVFYDIPLFDMRIIPEIEIIDDIKIKTQSCDKYGEIWNGDIARENAKFLNYHSNIIMVFSDVSYVQKPDLKQKQWSWVYHCWDSSIVELFTKNKDIAEFIEFHYSYEEIKYPGFIGSPGDYTVDT